MIFERILTWPVWVVSYCLNKSNQLKTSSVSALQSNVISIIEPYHLSARPDLAAQHGKLWGVALRWNGSMMLNPLIFNVKREPVF